MSRRRKKNNLLPKMMLVAVLVNAILFPILAQLGVFKAGHGRANIPVTLIKLPPPQPKPKLLAKKAQPHHQAAHKSAAKPTAAPRSARPDLPHPNLMAGKPGPGAGTSPIAVDPHGTIAPGTVPKSMTPAPPTQPTATTPAQVVPPQPPQPAVAPSVVTTKPKPEPAQHVLVPAKVLVQVKPTVPDDLAVDMSPQPFHASFHIHADGTAEVRQTSGTGIQRLDELALQAARQWKFQPATSDGMPVDSYLRLTVEFDEQG